MEMKGNKLILGLGLTMYNMKKEFKKFIHSNTTSFSVTFLTHQTSMCACHFTHFDLRTRQPFQSLRLHYADAYQNFIIKATLTPPLNRHSPKAV
jgi:hypothetical protein